MTAFSEVLVAPDGDSLAMAVRHAVAEAAVRRKPLVLNYHNHRVLVGPVDSVTLIVERWQRVIDRWPGKKP